MKESDREALRARCAEREAEGNVCLAGLTVDECEDMAFGYVPRRVQELAKTATDWWWQDFLAKNAAKPAKRKRGA